LALLLASLVAGPAGAQSLYKYRGPDGEWMFSDRPPPDDQPAEVRELASGVERPTVKVTHELLEERMYLRAHNGYYAPVELVLGIDELRDIEAPAPDQPLRFVVPARDEIDLFSLAGLANTGSPSIRYRYTWLVGDPMSEHRPELPYRVPFAVASGFPVSQAFPTAVTHTTADSRHAVDIVMPIGTDVHAARGGIVFEVTSQNFRSGTDQSRDGPAANLVRILHDDGTWAEYAHLNRSTIRVRPGDVVERGEYIADSGNTGFSTGPHLHFAVLRNRGLGIESLPVTFAGPNGSEIVAETGGQLVAY
jgi:murein DD-endopeptidase MepM/ murein hydrolase activator NlpD